MAHAAVCLWRAERLRSPLIVLADTGEPSPTTEDDGSDRDA